jgi:hypothetical protein
LVDAASATNTVAFAFQQDYRTRPASRGEDLNGPCRE